LKTLLVCLILISVCLKVQAQVIDVYTEEFPPYQIQLSPKKVTGVSTKLVKSLLDEADVQYKIHVLPWYRSYHNTLKEKNSLLFSVSRTKEREDLFEWIMPLCDINVSFFWKKENKNIAITSVFNAKKHVVSVASGQPSELYLREKGFSTDDNLVILASHEQGLGLLYKDRVDVIFAADLFIENLIKETYLGKLELNKFSVNALSKKLFLTANKSSDPSLVNHLKILAQKKDRLANRRSACNNLNEDVF